MRVQFLHGLPKIIEVNMKKRKIHFFIPRRGATTQLEVLSDGTRVMYIDIGNLPKDKLNNM